MTIKTTIDTAFTDIRPANLLPDSPPAGPCGGVDCVDGWIETPHGMARCKACAANTRSAQLAEQYNRAGVEGTLYQADWNSIVTTHASWRMAKALADSVGDVVRDCLNVAMVGLKGRGKTQAAVLVAKAAIEADYSALVVGWSEWVDEVQSDYTRRAKTQAEHVATLTAPDLLVLDDVGAASSRDGDIERKLFTRVIGARYNMRRPTIITANLKKTELEEAMGYRAFDRIAHACEWVLFDGPAYRAEVEAARVQSTLERIRKAAGL